MYLPTVSITKPQLQQLHDMTRKGTHKAREISRAEILLLAHDRLDEAAIATRARCHVRTVRRVVARFNDDGLDRALYDAPRSGQPRKTTDLDDAYLTALACTQAQHGSAHWTLDMLTAQFVKDRKKKIGRHAIWLRLSQRGIKPWREKNVVYPEGHAGVHGAHGRRTRAVRTPVRSKGTRALS